MTVRPAVRRGVTLLELLVVLAVLGVALSVVALSPPRANVESEAPVARAVGEGRRRAVEGGVIQTERRNILGRDVLVTSLPDGQVIVDSMLPRLPVGGRP